YVPSIQTRSPSVQVPVPLTVRLGKCDPPERSARAPPLPFSVMVPVPENAAPRLIHEPPTVTALDPALTVPERMLKLPVVGSAPPKVCVAAPLIGAKPAPRAETSAALRARL